MDKNDLKKLALLGICSGMILGSNAAFAESHEPPPEGEDAKTEKNGCSGKNGCGGPGGCGGSNGAEDKDEEKTDEASSEEEAK